MEKLNFPEKQSIIILAKLFAGLKRRFSANIYSCSIV